jgi:protein involved in polysaccharide export with SLBB domain
MRFDELCVARMIVLLMAAVLAGCHATDGTILLDPRGEAIEVTPEEIRQLSGGEQPYLVQVGDQLNLAFRVRDYRSDQADWDYRIEVGDTMEVRLSQDPSGIEPYRFDAGDLVGISFLNNWSLNVTRTVRPDGFCTFEHVGDVRAGGLTPSELQEQLTRLYAATGLIEGDPNITVTVEFSNPDRLDNISRDLVVRPDGKIRLPVIGNDIKVAGLTVGEACGRIRGAASAVVKNPPVVSMMVYPYINSALGSMNGVYRVRPDGAISVPRIGEVQAAGYSVPEITDMLAGRCEGLVHNPVEPALDLVATTGGRVFIGGEVDMPGVYPLEATPTALQAVIMAQGPNDRSRLNSVLVIRRNPSGKPYVFKTNLNLALKGHTENDMPLRSFDVVYVPKKLVSRANLFVQQYIDDIVPFDNSLGVTGTYYLNTQRSRTTGRSFNYTTGVNVIPGMP